jgi:O-antigen/teichoic acid export membrane protein
MDNPSHSQVQTSNNLNPPEALSKKVAVGGTWVIILRIANRGLDFFRTIILARLLSPADFGLLGIALLSMSMLETFSQTGFKAALIQKKEDITSYLDTAWTVSVLRGFVLFLLIFLSAPMIAIFFESLEAVSVIRVLAISTLLTGFQNIGVLYFQKELDFKKHALYQISITVAHVAATITLAFVLRNVWALVIGGLFANFVRSSLSYAIHPYRPRFTYQKEKASQLFRFGKWILLSTIVIFFARQGDDLFLGKVLGITALGFYQMAFLIGNTPSSEITGVVSTVAFPAYSKIKDTPKKLNDVYLKTLGMISMISLPLTGGLITLAHPFTGLCLGDKWLPIVAPLQILALSGFLRSITGTGGSLFNAIGKPRFDFRMNSIRLAIIVLTIYPLTKLFGMSGTSLSVLFGLAAATSYWSHQLIKEIGITFKQFFEIFIPSLVGTLAMCGIIKAFGMMYSTFNTQMGLFLLSILIGILSYILVILMTEKFSKYRALDVFVLLYKSAFRSTPL